MSSIAVIGTGNMGAPMAINLAGAGHRVTAFDLVPAKTAALQQHGVRQAADHRTAILDVDVVLTMLPSGAEVRDVYENQVFGNVSHDALLIDSSTIDLATCRDLHQQASQQQLNMLDAPVSGGTPAAAAGSLTFMVGGDERALEIGHKTLEAMAGRIVHCGVGGMGQAAKMCNNMMLGVQMASLAEGFQLARQVGLTDSKLYEVASSSSADCFSLRTFCPVPDVVESCPANNGYRPGFSADLMLKDMGLALAAAEEAGLKFDMAPRAEAIYRQLSDAGRGDMDFSGIFTLRESSAVAPGD